MEITEYFDELGQSGISGVARVRKLTAIPDYFSFIEGEGAIAKSPAAGSGTPMKGRCRSA
jgi:site-specific recombinase XerD